ncbi:C40 family peptidase [Cytophaga hutchinsonii]|uniref:Cell wall-associated hydrolase n=1 Tax=Cytophaga hutchinsonii (strain ATCC 33406 / DSM 1761 / CIP 103989 / NBRC 15051 / NCIMB 9469 / D465) TaxID=269798 RepID=A0A6N4SRJ2_CYTH3|nr:C40 family peptidase [Cytophaga hutchinsonii]ABG58925.1 cell wall-associated hydrolase [Cytophaga hutchinsonii ATCC 33406]SFX82173.1 NlpC/P60 family protein [Cytophaga hutchinsonii ATCC 33406]
MRLKVISLFVFAALFFAGFTTEMNSDGFQQVLDNTSNPTVKNQLERFQKGGIEKTVDTSEYSANEVIAYAKTFIGTPHVMGGVSKKGVDCSGLIMVAHKQAGVILPHSSHEQGRYGTVIPNVDSLKKGDLLFYYSSYSSSNFITHVGIYLGDGTFIHASNRSGVIITNTSDSYWKEKYLFATRFKN